MFFEKPKVDLASMLRILEGECDAASLQMDLSVIRDEASGVLVTNPLEVIAKVERLETIIL